MQHPEEMGCVHASDGVVTNWAELVRENMYGYDEYIESETLWKRHFDIVFGGLYFTSFSALQWSGQEIIII